MNAESQNLKSGCFGWAVVASIVSVLVGFFVVGPFAVLLPLPIAGLAWWLTREVDVPPISSNSTATLSRLSTDHDGNTNIPLYPEDLSKPDFNAGRVISQGSDVRSFEYVDVDGVVTFRSIMPWREYRHHIRGYCLMAGAERTFRKDRINP